MSHRWHIARACRKLNRGGVIAYPTETVFGLGCDPTNEHAVRRLLQIKNRPWQKGLILVGASLEQFTSFIQPLAPTAIAKMLAPQPGPTTWVVAARSEVPRWLRGNHASLAIRISSHPIVIALCRSFGAPIVSTSANMSGQAPLRSEFAVRRTFERIVDYIVPGVAGPYLRPSEIRDLASGHTIRSS